MNNSTTNTTAQIIQQAVNSWTVQNKQVTAYFQKHEDSFYLNEVAPGRSRAIYLLGHLVAVSDGLLSLFGLGDKLYPELEDVFLKSPDNADTPMPSITELKQKWETVNATLTQHFNAMGVDSWLDKHTAVSVEDFQNEPMRNKLNVLLSRTVHQGYHLGQLNLLK